jgi:hypothetical protein
MHATTIPAIEMTPAQHKPPSYGAPQRDAIGSIVDGLVDDLCQRIGGIRETLDQIEQQALQSAAAAKGSLSDHVSVCMRLNDEINRTQAVVAEIRQQMANG